MHKVTKYIDPLIDLAFKKIFYDKLRCICIELSKFIKEEEELENDLDKWLSV